MKYVSEIGIRLVLPLLIGTILYAQVYILHYFEDMQFGWLSFLVMLTPVLLIFEVDRQISRYFQRRTPQFTGYIRPILLPFLVSLVSCMIMIFALYIPGKLWEIRNGAQDTIGGFHIISMCTQVFFMVVIANAFHQVRFLIRKWQEEAIRASKLEKENVQAKLETLQNQISPHFLFNNFNTLYGLIDHQPKQAKTYLMKLSSLYRRVLAGKNEEIVRLQEELQTLTDYLFLLEVRFGTDIITEIEMQADDGGYYLPPMSLQMLVENAIKHNNFNEDRPLKIGIKQEGDMMIVSNNRDTPKVPIPSNGIGLQNIRNRYHLLSHKSIQIEATKTMFQVKIPLLQIIE